MFCGVELRLRRTEQEHEKDAPNCILKVAFFIPPPKINLQGDQTPKVGGVEQSFILILEARRSKQRTQINQSLDHQAFKYSTHKGFYCFYLTASGEETVKDLSLFSSVMKTKIGVLLESLE